MRQLGTLDSRQNAELFRDYLEAREIRLKLEASNGSIDLWVLDEDHLEKAKQEFAAFQEHPDDSKYHRDAQQIRDEREQKRARAFRKVQKKLKVRQQRHRSIIFDFPITVLLIVGSVFVTLITQFDDNQYGVITELSIVDYKPLGSDRISFYSDLREVRSGEVWRLITPIFIHFDEFHLLFNMYWTYLFGSLIESRTSWWRFLLLVLVIGVVSNLGEFYFTLPQFSFELKPTFGGMSGVDFGLFGFIWIKGVLEPEKGMELPPLTVYLFIGFLFLCMTGVLGTIANVAHTVGLLVGCLIAAAGPVFNRYVANRAG